MAMTMEQARAKADDLNATAEPGTRFQANYFTNGGWYVRGHWKGVGHFDRKTWIAAK